MNSPTGAAIQILIVNIPPELSEAELRGMFEKFGKVLSSSIGMDKKTGTSAGYGIVEMPVKHEARDAVDALKGKEIQGKALRVRILKPDDPFHGSLKTGGHEASGGSKFRPEGGGRGAGALRRGGQRGS